MSRKNTPDKGLFCPSCDETLETYVLCGVCNFKFHDWCTKRLASVRKFTKSTGASATRACTNCISDTNSLQNLVNAAFNILDSPQTHKSEKKTRRDQMEEEFYQNLPKASQSSTPLSASTNTANLNATKTAPNAFAPLYGAGQNNNSQNYPSSFAPSMNQQQQQQQKQQQQNYPSSFASSMNQQQQQQKFGSQIFGAGQGPNAQQNSMLSTSPSASLFGAGQPFQFGASNSNKSTPRFGDPGKRPLNSHSHDSDSVSSGCSSWGSSPSHPSSNSSPLRSRSPCNPKQDDHQHQHVGDGHSDHDSCMNTRRGKYHNLADVSTVPLSKLPRNSRACDSCTKGHRKCNLARPCQRCVSKSIVCTVTEKQGSMEATKFFVQNEF